MTRYANSIQKWQSRILSIFHIWGLFIKQFWNQWIHNKEVSVLDRNPSLLSMLSLSHTVAAHSMRSNGITNCRWGMKIQTDEFPSDGALVSLAPSVWLLAERETVMWPASHQPIYLYISRSDPFFLEQPLPVVRAHKFTHLRFCLSLIHPKKGFQKKSITWKFPTPVCHAKIFTPNERQSCLWVIVDALPVTKNINAELNAWASKLLVHTSAQKTFATTIETYNNDFDEDAKLCACCTSLSVKELGVIRKCISSDSQVSLTQKQVFDDSGKLASVYSKASPASSGSPCGSDVIDDTNYRVTAHFKTLISELVALAHLLYTHTF